MLVSSIQRSQGLRVQKVLVNLAITILVGVVAQVGTAEISLAMYHSTIWSEVSTPLLLIVAAWFSLWLGADLYRVRSPRGVWHDIPSLVSSALQWGGLMLVVLVILRAGMFELSLVGILVVLGVPSRIAVRVLPHLIIKGLGLATPTRVLIVGSGQIAELVAASLLKYDAMGTTVVGFVDDHAILDGKSQVLGLPTYGIAHLDRLISARQINHVVFAFSHLPDSMLVKLMRVCQAHPNVEVTLIPRFYEAISPRTRLLDMHGVPHLQMPTRYRRVDRALKKVFERAVAAVGLVLCAPLLLLAAIAIRIESPGPVIFRQERVGRGGTIFKMYKLRSMREPRPEEDPDAPARYTGVGALLRKYSIDELPQLWNVLRGDMSLVGPRPEREEYVKLFSEQIPDYHLRHRVRGGLTGLAQITGLRGATSIVERTRLDNFYIENWTFWLDLKILFLTFRALIPLSQGLGGDLMFLDLVSEVARIRTPHPAVTQEAEKPAELEESIHGAG